MRSTIIFITFAIAAIAAPLPTAEPWSRKTGDRTVQDPFETERRSAAPEPFGRGTHSKAQSENADEDDVENNFSTQPKQQDQDGSAVTESSKREAKPDPTVRGKKNQKRTEGRIGARGTHRPSQNGAPCHPGWNSNRCGIDNKRSTEDNVEYSDTEVEADKSLDERDAEPGYTRNDHSYRRSAEAEADPGYTRNDHSYRRSAEAEAAISHSDQGIGSCHPGLLLSSHC